MSKRTLHFVYAMPRPSKRRGRLADLARRKVACVTGRPFVPWRGGHLSRDRTVPLGAPLSITVSLVEHFQKSYKVLAYDWLESDVVPRYGPNDIILGHLAPGHDTVMQRFVECERPAAAKILLEPFSHRILADNAFILPALSRIDAFAAICGPYWMDTISQSPFAPYERLMHRMDMAINIREYPQLKRSFNPAGKRRFIYIGSSSKPAKGCYYLSLLAETLPDVEFGWIGSGARIPYVRHVSGNRALGAGFMRSICERYDFLIHMGVSDANPTTILEAMAWGLPVICTPQTGYYNVEGIFEARLDSVISNMALIERLQVMPEGELLEISRVNRQKVATRYTWDNFFCAIDEVIDHALNSKSSIESC
jgi:glycosyltransferase involved in cell wall biosynthesis